MLKIAVGHSNDPDSLEAVNEVLEQCQNSLSGEIPQAGILFAAFDFDHELILHRINEVFPNIELIGGTTDGELSSVLEFQLDSITLMLFCADDIEIRAAVGRDVSKDPFAIAQQTIETAKQAISAPLKFCIATPESITTNSSAILNGLKSGLGSIPVFGGATAAQRNGTSDYQFFKTEVLSDSVPILLFAGNVLFSHGIAGGWHPIGKRGVVTKVEGNTVYEIDSRPALEFYQYYFDTFATDAAYPLAVFPPGEDKFFLRGSPTYDPELGSLRTSGEIPLNSVVQIAEAEQADILAASRTAFDRAWETYPGQEPAAALIFSCCWRRWILGSRISQEYEDIARSLHQKLEICGFYTYGEIAPMQENGQSFFHNITFVTLLLGNR
ncbi:FIST signal transduction protein [Pseudanabaena sp. PCC 6802]|uniref:FIST signal transduction protein n=1 Tax=Pseudanabaena sp. PCC 6802 TaxID=118173 RepID=UPI00034D2AD7|nr:FIST N-terminal domain-containing protein [Pseudanabaena sp. PCC 6802]